MSRALSSLTDEELGEYCDRIAKSAEAARVVGGPIPAVVEHASEEAAREAASRWGLA